MKKILMCLLLLSVFSSQSFASNDKAECIEYDDNGDCIKYEESSSSTTEEDIDYDDASSEELEE